MKMVTSISAMQKIALDWKRKGIPVGFVPTMGYLHAGHISLVAEARKKIGKKGIVVVSIYVNPTQFAPSEDLAKYPRDLAGDKRLCKAAGVDVIFAPSDASMYSAENKGKYSTYVNEEQLSMTMEGRSRATHFKGVTTVVAKLFNLVLPEFAVFGMKDFQQAAIIQRMVRDLNFPVKIIVAPTVREPDGLAMSSRNKYLSEDQRPQALSLYKALQAARLLVRNASEPVDADFLKHEIQLRIEENPAARVDYIEFFDPASLIAVKQVTRGIRMALAVFIGKTRLIDNLLLK